MSDHVSTALYSNPIPVSGFSADPVRRSFSESVDVQAKPVDLFLDGAVSLESFSESPSDLKKNISMIFDVIKKSGDLEQKDLDRMPVIEPFTQSAMAYLVQADPGLINLGNLHTMAVYLCDHPLILVRGADDETPLNLAMERIEKKPGFEDRVQALENRMEEGAWPEVQSMIQKIDGLQNWDLLFPALIVHLNAFWPEIQTELERL